MVVRKKLLVIAVALIGVISGVYAYYNAKMNAAGSFQFQKGNKVVVGSYNSSIAWDVAAVNGNQLKLMSTKEIDSIGVDLSTCAVQVSGMHYSCAQPPYSSVLNNITFDASLETPLVTIAPYVPTVLEAIQIPAQDRMWPTQWHWINGYVKVNWDPTHPYNSVQGPVSYKGGSYSEWSSGTSITAVDKVGHSSCSSGGVATLTMLRAYAEMDASSVVFAASRDYTIGKWYAYQIRSGLSDYNDSGALKLRIYDSQFSARLNGIYWKNNTTKQITKTVKNSTVQLDTTVTGNGIVSVLLYDSAGNTIKHFRMMGSATGQYISVDLTGIPVGKYQVAIINEESNGSDRPTRSSEISNQMPLEIVEPHEIQYTKTPGSGATKGDYEYSKNVKEGQAVGKITLNPTGVTPIVYELISDGDNSYQNLEIDGLDSNHASGAASLNVKIKNGAPDLDNGGLKAGTYKFCITSTDDNGYPDT